MEGLERRLERLGNALGRAPETAPLERRAEGASTPGAPQSARGPMVLALALIAAAVATGSFGLILPTVLLGIVAGVVLIATAGQAAIARMNGGAAARDPSRPHIGMGATVAADAVVEPGAVVEMGATVGRGAVVRRGAIVRMGSTVGAGAVVEEDAVVGWGASIGRDAVIGRGGVVGAGCDVRRGAHLPAGMRLAPGSQWASQGAPAGSASSSVARAETVAPSAAVAAPPVDPRRARIDASCDRLHAELQQTPAHLRDALGFSAQTVASLRQTCHGLLARERVLRAESSPEGLAFLAQEQAELERRAAAASDEAVRRSLGSAVAAIAEQRRQRGLLARSAERLDAEAIRLQWTLDGMAAQLVRLRAAGNEVTGAAGGEVLATMRQLEQEIDAIATALEEVAEEDRAAGTVREPATGQPAAAPHPLINPVAPISDAGPHVPGRTRERG